MFITTPSLRFAEGTDDDGATPKPSDAPKPSVALNDQQKAEMASETLGEGGKKALQAEREARATAERERAELQKRIDAIESEKLSDLEKAQKAAEDAAEKAGTTAAENMRLKFALDNSVPAAWINRLVGNSPEELAEDWATIQPTLAVEPPGKGAHVPGAGRSPEQPPAVAEQIRSAEAEGNTALAMSLKGQQLAELRNQN